MMYVLYPVNVVLDRIVAWCNKTLVIHYSESSSLHCLQCFDTFGWAAGTAFGL